MREYTIVRKGEQLNWDNVPSLPIDSKLNTPEDLPITAKAQLCYDDEALYVRLSAVEADIRAEHTGLLDEICEDSCLEFFFSPMGCVGDKRYFNLECNPNGAMYLGFGSSISTLMRLIHEDPCIEPKGQRTADGWEVSYTITHEFVRRFFPNYAPGTGVSIRANCFKCGDKTPQKHYLSWNPVVKLPRASFHNPELFGLMHFE